MLGEKEVRRDLHNPDLPGSAGGRKQDLLERSEPGEGTSWPSGRVPRPPQDLNKGRALGQPPRDGRTTGNLGRPAREGKTEGKVIGEGPDPVSEGVVRMVVGDIDNRRDEGVRNGLNRDQEPVEARRPRVRRGRVLGDVEKSVGIVGNVADPKVILEPSPLGQKVARREGGGKTSRVRGPLNEIKVTTHKGRNRGIKGDQTVENITIEPELGTGLEVDVDKLEGRTREILRGVTPNLDMTLGVTRERNGGACEKTADTRGVDDKSTTRTHATITVIDDVPVAEGAWQGETLRRSQMGLLEAQNVDILREIK
jgi:hypothetical protein